MKVNIYNQKAEKVETLELPKDLFGLSWNDDLVHQIAVSMMANQRKPIAHAKDRSEVIGSGKKPWPQKGTGRARHGSKKSPIWIGGGVTHGPRKERKYTKKINQKMKRKAFFTVLSQKLKDKEILFLDKIVIVQPKTKDASKIISDISKIGGFEKLAVKKRNKAIVVLAKKDDSAFRSFRNIAGLKISEFKNLNVLDLLNYKFLIISDPKGILKTLLKN